MTAVAPAQCSRSRRRATDGVRSWVLSLMTGTG